MTLQEGIHDSLKQALVLRAEGGVEVVLDLLIIELLNYLLGLSPMEFIMTYLFREGLVVADVVFFAHQFNYCLY